jgi:uncharacterized membrane protein (DUF485 family)
MDDKTVANIQRDPNYQELVRTRKAFGWTLAIIMLVIYYGFIALVAFAPSVIGIDVGSGITLGLPLGVGVILSAIILTGIYVLRANSRYDDLTRAIVSANVGGAKPVNVTSAPQYSTPMKGKVGGAAR